MADPTFVHLRVHSEYSIEDGMVRIKPLIQACIANQFPAVAVTDLNNAFACVKFYRQAMGAGIKPIIGAEVRVLNGDDPKQPFSLILLCQNHEGFLQLSRLLTRGYLEGQATGSPQLHRDWFVADELTQLIALSGAGQGDIGQALLSGNHKAALTHLQRWCQLFPQRFYIELQRTNKPQENDYIAEAVALASEQQIPVVATNGVCFLSPKDFEAHEARLCIHQGRVLADPKRPKNYTEQQYLRSASEMQQLFADIPSAITNTVEIAKRCSLSLPLGTYHLPQFPIPDGLTMEQYFEQVSAKGLEQRLDILWGDKKQEKRAPYDDRLKEELEVINNMGFAGYFLIVADFIQWAKNHGIPVGPGRGSGAGSLIAYALKITDLDPLAYDLLFERFLNPERVSMPDFDVDFCMDGRDRVIDYVANHYGRESVSQIITYGTMAAKAVVRDVGRVLNHAYGFVDKIAKLIPFEIGMTLDKALAEEPALLERYQNEEEVRELIDLAKKLEGITRNAGKHAGGVVIAPSKLTDFTPLYCEPGGESPVTQFDKDDVETIGLVKFDFLGLRTLTIINWAVQTVNRRRAQQGHDPIDINLIPVDDSKTFDLLKSCMTTAVFQLESRGMKDLIKRLQPDCFEDIIALVALFRPGPLQSGMVDDFIARKHGVAKVEYPHDDLAPILKPTYGVILYQEQVMQIAQVLAGYTLGGADLLRRAMGKKKPEEMAKQRQIFTEGAVARDVDKKTATSIFDLMEKFAGYGFNKSHSAAYALVAYQTAWLKAHYPAAFMAAVLSSDLDNTDKVLIFYQECLAMGLPISNPNINEGDYHFTVDDAGKIIYGLGAIKGVGESVVQQLVEERNANGPYQDLYQFCVRVDLKKCNKRALEAFIRSGAFDCFQQNRPTLLASLEKAIAMAQTQEKNQLSGQGDLFALFENHAKQAAEYTHRDDWNLSACLQAEKETLGFYLSGHPLDCYKNELQSLSNIPISNLAQRRDQSALVVGVVQSYRELTTKRGDKMAFVNLQDQTGQLEVALFSDVLQFIKERISKDQVLFISGEVGLDDYTGGYRLSAQQVFTLSQARLHFGKSIKLNLDSTQLTEDQLSELESILASHQGIGLPIKVEYNNGQAKAEINLGKSWQVEPSDELLQKLESWSDKPIVLDYS